VKSYKVVTHSVVIDKTIIEVAEARKTNPFYGARGFLVIDLAFKPS